ncbi:hypothetical protein ACEXQB_012905 [Herbiconiux sp. P18]|uniref:hypothetical protein n=1 Tax=Herbiconiux liangxiaofengii TaxID=3342795 RepID=UPI0035BA43F5
MAQEIPELFRQFVSESTIYKPTPADGFYALVGGGKYRVDFLVPARDLVAATRILLGIPGSGVLTADAVRRAFALILDHADEELDMDVVSLTYRIDPNGSGFDPVGAEEREVGLDPPIVFYRDF